jgi:predicted ribosomally synthesized peptide with nif11-like leader
MSIASAQNLLHKVAIDSEFREKLQGAHGPEKRAVLESYGFGDVTNDEIKAAAANFSKSELSDEELEAVAGGSLCGWLECIGVWVAVAIALS